MKKVYLLISFCLSLNILIGQGLIRREVYNFMANDTFVYYNFSAYQSPVTYYDYKMYVYKTVDFDTTQQSVSYSGNLFTKAIHWNYLGSGQFSSYFTLDSNSFLLTYDSLNSYCFDNFCSDDTTIYTTQVFEGRNLIRDTFENHQRLRYIEYGGLSMYLETNLCERLGLTKTYSAYEDHSPGLDYYLAYYHLATGETGGTAVDFVSDIADLKDFGPTVRVIGNPIHHEFQLQISELPHKSTYFKLFNAWGELVKKELISSTSITFPRDNLSNGLYCWQLEAGGEPLSSGKLILE